MATSSESFSHGVHNEKACDLLELTHNFPDWTITTAFYASLHFVTSKIFPLKYKVKDIKMEFENLEDFQKFKNYGQAQRHQLLKDLVGEHCDLIASKYEWLLSSSWNARYHSHRHPVEIVNKAVSYMKDIKKYCSPASANISKR